MRRLLLLTCLAFAVAACGTSADPLQQATPDFPGDALRWRSLRWQDEAGRVPADAWGRALQQRRDLVATTQAIDDGGVAPAAWIEHGPLDVAGRTRTLVIDPRDPRRLWSGGVSGGLWFSPDRGQSWQPVDDWWSNLAIGCLTMDPSAPDVMYVGTGEGFVNVNVQRGVNSSSVRGSGILKSTDGGRTWVHLAATAGWDYVTRIAVSPLAPNLVVAARRPGGLWRSTDGGTTWTQVHNAFASYQVAFDPNDPSKLVAHVLDASLATHGVVRSTDAGATWLPAQSGLTAISGYDSRIELCYAASVPGVVYASCGESGGTVWRSADGGANWTRRTTSGSSGCNWYFNGFWVDPTNENVMVIGAYHVYRSTDGGRTLTRISDGYLKTVDPHPDVHHVVADQGYNGTSNRRVYVATDGGLHVADDVLAARIGGGWRDIDAGQRTCQYYSADGHGPSGLIVGGLQDNGTLRQNSNGTTILTFGGDGGVTRIDPTDPTYVYGEYVWLRVFRSRNGGNSASFVYSGISDAANQQANFIAPLELDPSDPNRLYGGGASLWRTSNARSSGISWSAIKPSVGSFISAIVIDPVDPNVIWVGHNDGRLFRTGNGLASSPTWSPVDDNGARDPLPDRYLSRLLIDPQDRNVVWATFGGFASGNVQVTRDGGTSWSDASGAGARRLPDAPVNCIARHPDHAGVLYVATEVGLFATDDGGAAWSASNDGPANVATEEVRFMSGTRRLLAATLGRGVWTADVRLPAATPFGTTCSNDPAPPALAIDPQSPARVGRTVTWLGSGLRAGAPVTLVLGLSRTVWAGGGLPVPLDGIGMVGCALLVSPDFALPTTADAGGTATWSLPVPQDPALLGAPFHGQAFGAAPGLNALGLAATRGLTATLGW